MTIFRLIVILTLFSDISFGQPLHPPQSLTFIVHDSTGALTFPKCEVLFLKKDRESGIMQFVKLESVLDSTWVQSSNTFKDSINGSIKYFKRDIISDTIYEIDAKSYYSLKKSLAYVIDLGDDLIIAVSVKFTQDSNSLALNFFPTDFFYRHRNMPHNMNFHYAWFTPIHFTFPQPWGDQIWNGKKINNDGLPIFDIVFKDKLFEEGILKLVK